MTQDDGEDVYLEAARRAVSAAEEAQEAAQAEGTPDAVRATVKKALEEARNLLQLTMMSPKSLRKQRQSIKEFTSMLGEEVVEAAEDTLQEGLEYAERTLRKAKSLIEDHFHIDEAFRMLGPIRQDANLARDLHDWFNLIALLPVIFLNLVNWTCSGPLCGFTQGVTVQTLWNGERFYIFWWTSCIYFFVDLLWMLVVPDCVRSPGVIIKHHVVTLAYILIPYNLRRVDWMMGACMLVEVNTWFLIARRSFNKRGDKPFQTGVSLAKSVRLLTVSVCFYVTWFVIRLGIYPYLFVVITRDFFLYSAEIGTYMNLLLPAPLMQCVFIFLNIKWTIDLIRSKLKGSGRSKGL